MEASEFRTSNDINIAAQRCKQRLRECLKHAPLMEMEWAENRLADFNLWSATTGVFASNKASLDARLAFDQHTTQLVLITLRSLEEKIKECLASDFPDGDQAQEPDASSDDSRDEMLESFPPWILDTGTEYSEESGNGEESEDKLALCDLSRVQLEVEKIIDQLVRLAIVIRKSGTNARARKADARFDSSQHQGLRSHLALIVSARGSEEGRESFDVDAQLLTPVQERLITTNLMRRHRFIYFKRHAKKLARNESQHGGFSKEKSVLDKCVSPALPDQTMMHVAEPAATTATTPKHLTSPSSNLEASNFLSATEASQMSHPLGPSQTGKLSSQAALTGISTTAAKVIYPHPPAFKPGTRCFQCPCCSQALGEMFQQPTLWKKHLMSDLCPYTCIIGDCPCPERLYSSRQQWQAHVETEHQICWQCPLCDLPATKPKLFPFAKDLEDHFAHWHSESVEEEQCPTLVAHSARPAPLSIKSCPLCRFEDSAGSEALLDHIAEHVHQFSLRSLPWGANSGPDNAPRDVPDPGDLLFDEDDYFQNASEGKSLQYNVSSDSQVSGQLDDESTNDRATVPDDSKLESDSIIASFGEAEILDERNLKALDEEYSRRPQSEIQHRLDLRDWISRNEPSEHESNVSPMTDEVKRTPEVLWTYRIQGVPLGWGASDLATFLIKDSRCNLREDGFEIKSVELNHRKEFQDATFESLDGTPLPESIRARPSSTSVAQDAVVRLQCDDKFHGLTTLFCPKEEEHHLVDVVTVSGLNGHPIGSFRSKKSNDDYLWLRDALPQQLTAQNSNEPIARIMTYGYESALTGYENYQHMGDIAGVLKNTLCSLGAKRPLILIAHSLGGLIVKEVMISASHSNEQDHARLLASVYGIAFFGVPHAGMTVERLAAMAGTGPALGTVINVSEKVSYVLDNQRPHFSRALDKCGRKELFCFYETLPSPTPEMINGKWKTTDTHKELLVTKSSATHCSGPGEEGFEHFCGIVANHSDIVKFKYLDPSYEPVRERISGLCRRALEAGKQREDPSRRVILPGRNNDFVVRTLILDNIEQRFELDKPASQRKCSRVAIYGLAGIGKTQIAIEFAHRVKEKQKRTSVFWVHASNEARFRQAYSDIAAEFEIPGHDDPKEDVLELVFKYLRNNKERPWILIIDNADDKELLYPSKMDELGFKSTQGLSQYLPECDHGLVLMTTRVKDVAIEFTYGQAFYEVGNLSEDEAVQLINRSLGNERTTETEAHELSKRMEYLPLALAQALTFVKEHAITVAEYMQMFDSNEKQVKMLSRHFEAIGRDDETPNAVTASFIVSFRQIQAKDKLAAELLSLMSMLYQQVIQDRLIDIYLEQRSNSSTNGGGAVSKAKSLGSLKAYSLITSAADGTYAMHRLVHLVAKHWLLVEGRIDEFAARAIEVVGQACLDVKHEMMHEMAALTPHITAVLANSRPENESWKTKRMRGRILLKTSYYYSRSSRFGEAEMHAEAAYRLLVESFGPDDEDKFWAAAARLVVYEEQGRWTKGIELGEVERAQAAKAMGKEHDVTLRITRVLGVLHYRQGSLKEAKELLIFASEAHKAKYGVEHQETLNSMNDLGHVYQRSGRLDEALDLHKMLVETQTRLNGEEHPDTLASQANLAAIFQKQRNFEEAGRILADVINVKKRILGPEHSSTLASMHALAWNHGFQSNLEQAEELGGRVWKLQKKTLGHNHPDTLVSMHNYANYTYEMGRTSEAITLMRDCCIRFEGSLGANHRGTILSNQRLQEWEHKTAKLEGQNAISATATAPRVSLGSAAPETGGPVRRRRGSSHSPEDKRQELDTRLT